jgi:hypothetical protein
MDDLGRGGRVIHAAWETYLGGEWGFVEACSIIWAKPGSPSPQKIKSTDTRDAEKDFIKFVAESKILENIKFGGNIGTFMKEAKCLILSEYTNRTLDEKQLSSLLQKPVISYIKANHG